MKYPICRALKRNAAIHCTALAITENFDLSQSRFPQVAQPKETLRNGTLTFVTSKGRTFGITCKHVVEHYREITALSGEGSYSMRTMLNGIFVVMDRFKSPAPQFGDGSLDIAIREVMPEFIARLGKQPFDLEASPAMPTNIVHGLAVGFPEALKRRTGNDGHGYRIAMPQMEVLAELSRTPMSRFQLFGELEEPPAHSDLSGMSGGPIFWSTEKDYGLLGITYEGGVGSDGRSIQIFGEYASCDVVSDWLSQI